MNARRFAVGMIHETSGCGTDLGELNAVDHSIAGPIERDSEPLCSGSTTGDRVSYRPCLNWTAHLHSRFGKSRREFLFADHSCPAAMPAAGQAGRRRTPNQLQAFIPPMGVKRCRSTVLMRRSLLSTPFTESLVVSIAERSTAVAPSR